MDTRAIGRAGEPDEEPLRALLVAPNAEQRARRRDQLLTEGYLTWTTGSDVEAKPIARREELDLIFVELTPEPALDADLVRRLAAMPELDGIPLVVSVGGASLGPNRCLRAGDPVAGESGLRRFLHGF